MAIFPLNGLSATALVIALAAAWGLACAAFERLLLAPRHRLSSIGPAYLPSMTLALFAGVCFLIGDHEIRFSFAVLMAGVFFVIGALPALAAFHLSRRIFRTRFLIETKN
jgi:hypothetical protein